MSLIAMTMIEEWDVSPVEGEWLDEEGLRIYLDKQDISHTDLSDFDVRGVASRLPEAIIERQYTDSGNYRNNIIRLGKDGPLFRYSHYDLRYC